MKLGYVYLLKAEGTSNYKIGVTNNVDKRTRQLQTGCAQPIVVVAKTLTIDPYAAEKILHRRYKRHRLRSNGEWFQFSSLKALLVSMDIKNLDIINQELRRDRERKLAVVLCIMLIVLFILLAV